MERPVDHDTVVEEWRRSAQQRDDENYEFLRSLKFRDYGYDPDELAGELHERAFQIVDCTHCANCCKTMDIKFDDEDIERIAGHLNIATVEFIEAHLDRPDCHLFVGVHNRSNQVISNWLVNGMFLEPKADEGQHLQASCQIGLEYN